MKIRRAVLTALLLAPTLPSLAQPRPLYYPELQARGISCADFRHNPLGSWTPVR